MTGGDLRFHITRKTFLEEAVKFWMAELGCALRYIHQQGIVHRDVKPDNVLLDAEGHVHLADFNVASDFTPARPLTSRSGTLAYLAPEVYAGRGYFSEVDWWSLGVVFYECIYSKRPFDANNPDALAQTIMRADVKFPTTSPAVSMPCLHAISSLLERNKTKRIGAASWESFIDNPFFRDIDFEALERKEIEPVFCPSSEKTNFDATYDLEELLLEEAPLEARARRQKPRAELREDATQQEIRAEELHKMIDTMFEPFNYTLLPQQRDPASEGLASIDQSFTGIPFSHSASTERNRDRAKTNEYGVSDRTRSGPSSRSETPLNHLARSRPSARSPNGSPPGSPPLSPTRYPAKSTVPSYQLPPQTNNYYQTPTSNPSATKPNRTKQPPHDQSSSSIQNRSHRRPGNFRSTSLGGGLQVDLESKQSWNDLNSQGQSGASSPDETTKRSDKASGVIAFFNRRKGRDRSPRPGKERERGVLGKEGARVIV